MFSHRCEVLVAVEEEYEGLQKRLSRNEVAELSEVELNRLIRIQRWNPRSRIVDPKVHEVDGWSGMKYSAMMCGPVCCRREVWRSPEKVVQKWSSWIVRGRINSSSFATGNIWVSKCRPKGPWIRWLYPHGGELLLIKERTEICPSCLKIVEEEIVWQAFTEFDMPRKVVQTEWDSSSPLGEIIWWNQRLK